MFIPFVVVWVVARALVARLGRMPEPLVFAVASNAVLVGLIAVAYGAGAR